MKAVAFSSQLLIFFVDEEDADDIDKGFAIEMMDKNSIKFIVTDGFGVTFETTIEDLQ